MTASMHIYRASRALEELPDAAADLIIMDTFEIDDNTEFDALECSETPMYHMLSASAQYYLGHAINELKDQVLVRARQLAQQDLLDGVKTVGGK